MHSFFDPIYRCAHMYVEFVLCIGPNEVGYHFVCVVVLGTIGDALDARLTHKEGGVTMCLLESS